MVSWHFSVPANLYVLTSLTRCDSENRLYVNICVEEGSNDVPHPKWG